MNERTKVFLSILTILAVIGYTIFNYATGKINGTYFWVFMAILCIPLMNMVNILIREWKDK